VYQDGKPFVSARKVCVRVEGERLGTAWRALRFGPPDAQKPGCPWTTGPSTVALALPATPRPNPKAMLDMGEPYASAVELVSFHSVSKGTSGECGLRGGYLELANIMPATVDQLYKISSINLSPNSIGAARGERGAGRARGARAVAWGARGHGRPWPPRHPQVGST
jgi:hypothetical protein